MDVRIRTAVGKRDRKTWTCDNCQFPLVTENYNSPGTSEDHFQPLFSFRASVFMQQSPLYPVAKHRMVPMRRAIEELVAIYERGLSAARPSTVPLSQSETDLQAETDSKLAVDVEEGKEDLDDDRKSSAEEADMLDQGTPKIEEPPRTKRDPHMSILIPAIEVGATGEPASSTTIGLPFSADAMPVSADLPPRFTYIEPSVALHGYRPGKERVQLLHTPSVNNSPLLQSGFGSRLLTKGRMLLPGQYPGALPSPEKQSVGTVLSNLKTALSCTSLEAQKVEDTAEKPQVVQTEPESVALLRSMFKPPPAPLAPEVVSDIASQEEIPQLVTVPAEKSPPTDENITITVVEAPKSAPKHRPPAIPAAKAKAKPVEPMTVVTEKQIVLQKMMLPQLPAFKSRRAKSGWRQQTPELAVAEPRRVPRMRRHEQTPSLGIFGNEILNKTLPLGENSSGKTPTEIYSYLESSAQAESMSRIMSQSFSAKKLPPHRLAVDFNLFKGVRRVAALKMKMHRVHLQ